MLLRVATFAVLAQKTVRELKEENEQHSEEQNIKAEELKDEIKNNVEEH